jgi:hypothetical protein
MRNYKNKKINFKEGQIMLLTAIFFVTFALTICLGFINPIIEQKKISDNYWNIKNNYYVVESGSEELLNRYKSGAYLNEGETFTINSSVVSIFSTSSIPADILRSEYNTSLYKKEILIKAQKDEDNKITIIDWREIK